MQPAGVGLGQLLLALDTTIASLVEAPRGLDLAVASAALIDSDDVRLGMGRGADSADVFFLLGVADERGPTLDRHWPGRATAGGHLRQGALRRAGRPGRRDGDSGGGRRTAGPLGAAVSTGQPRPRTPRRSHRSPERLRHRFVRPGAVARRPYSRHGQHRRRAVPRVGLFGIQRRSRRLAAAVDPGSGRSARAPEVDRPMGHLRRAAGRRATWSGSPSGRS